MEKFVSLLRGKGYKITPQRRAVIEALMDGERFSTAQQILERVKRHHPDVSLDTVYRNLNMLAKLNLVHEINVKHRDGNVFEIVREGHHHHLICTECGRMECLAVCPVNQAVVDFAERNGFLITGHLFELYGKCDLCRKKNRG